MNLARLQRASEKDFFKMALDDLNRSKQTETAKAKRRQTNWTEAEVDELIDTIRNNPNIAHQYPLQHKNPLLLLFFLKLDIWVIHRKG